MKTGRPSSTGAGGSRSSGDGSLSSSAAGGGGGESGRGSVGGYSPPAPSASAESPGAGVPVSRAAQEVADATGGAGGETAADHFLRRYGPGLPPVAVEAVKALVEAYKWAIDIEICVMPQEGMLNNPGTEALMIQALRNGARVIGAAPTYDSDSSAQVRRIFELAREFDVDIDMHVDSGSSAQHLDTRLVCELTEQYGWGGRVACGHLTKLSVMPLPELDEMAKRMAGAGVALTVLPSTDLYLGGRERDHRVERSVADANRLHRLGVLCSISSNNILNAFTPLGDGQLIRQANLYANVIQHAMPDDLQDTWKFFTSNSAKLMRRGDYGIAVGNPADLAVIDAPDPVAAIREIAPVLTGFKRGRRSFTRAPVMLHRPK